MIMESNSIPSGASAPRVPLSGGVVVQSFNAIGWFVGSLLWSWIRNEALSRVHVGEDVQHRREPGDGGGGTGRDGW